MHTRNDGNEKKRNDSRQRAGRVGAARWPRTGKRGGVGAKALPGPEPRLWACGGVCTVSTEILDQFVFRASVRWLSFYKKSKGKTV